MTCTKKDEPGYRRRFDEVWDAILLILLYSSLYSIRRFWDTSYKLIYSQKPSVFWHKIGRNHYNYILFLRQEPWIMLLLSMYEESHDPRDPRPPPLIQKTLGLFSGEAFLLMPFYYRKWDLGLVMYRVLDYSTTREYSTYFWLLVTRLFSDE